MADFVSWNDIFNGEYPTFAHRMENGKKENEKIQEHILLCEKYFYRIEKEKELPEIIHRFLMRHLPEGTVIQKKLEDFVYDMFRQVIPFHDFGKVNPQFQILKMGNKRMPVTRLEGLSGSEHSLFSAFLYLDYYLTRIEHSDFEDYIQDILFVFLWENAYVISRHHSNMDSLSSFIEKFDADDVLGELTEALGRNAIPGLKELQSFSKENLIKKAKRLRRIKKKFTRQQDIAGYFYVRFAYSVLVSCDYYATTEYMEDVEIESFGSICNGEDFSKPYADSKLVKEIKEYERESYGRNAENLKNCKDINVMRSEMYLDAEKMLQRYPNELIYFLEAPTGSGKSNTALNLSLQLLGTGKKIFYIYPFNTLVDQNKIILQDIFKHSEVKEQIVTVNSLTPIKGIHAKEDNTEEYYQKALLDRQFLNYPFILSTHVSFFETLFGNGRENLFSFVQLSGSVVILDEIQSYRNSIWAEIIIFLRECAFLMGMKIIIMSATLPGLEVLGGKECTVTRLIEDRNKYYKNPLFLERVKISYELLDQKMTMDTLLDQVKRHCTPNKKILVTFIRKDSAYEFYNRLLADEDINIPVNLITGDDSAYEREMILRPIREKKAGGLILVSTQVIEAGIDIDMDLGFKDISKLDSEEQFLGRINRSYKNDGMVYFFDMDKTERIYRDDYRTDEKFTLRQPRMREILRQKEFGDYYQEVLEVLRMQRNESTSSDGLERFFGETVKNLNFAMVADRMKLIEPDNRRMSLVLCRRLVMENGIILDGWEVWNQYLELLHNQTIPFARKQVELSEVRSKLNMFIYQVKWNQDLNYDGVCGELYCIRDGEQYFINGKLDRQSLESRGALFVD